MVNLGVVSPTHFDFFVGSDFVLWTPIGSSISTSNVTLFAFLIIPFITTVAIFVLHSHSVAVYCARDYERMAEKKKGDRTLGGEWVGEAGKEGKIVEIKDRSKCQ